MWHCQLLTSNNFFTTAQFVKDQHFGGLPQTSSNGNTDGSTTQDQGSGNRFKSQQERMDEIIAESKKRKLAARSEKEAQIQLVSQLDSQYDRFKALLQGNLMTEEDKIKVMPTDLEMVFSECSHCIFFIH